MSAVSTSVAAARGASRTLDGLLEHPRVVLGALFAGQLVGTLVLAATVPHNGWVWFHNGDQIWITTQGWMLGHLELPPTELGYLWSLVLAPIMWFTGPTFVQALPPIMALNMFVLAPTALLCVYGIAERIGGRLLGYWASLLWVVAPFASIPLFVDRYQERWTENFLPQALGLTSLSDFPSMVVVLVAALFVVRSLDAGRVAEAALAGLLLGAAGAMKPPNLLLGAGAVLAYLVARRWREGIVFGAAVVPSLLVLVLWKERGLGELPVLSLGEARVAAGAGLLALDVDRYIELDLDHWRLQMDQLREFFWSARLAQWAPLAGVLAVLRVRQAPIAALLGGWLAAFPRREGLLHPRGHPGEHLLASPHARLAGVPDPLRVDPVARADFRPPTRRPPPAGFRRSGCLALGGGGGGLDGGNPGRCDRSLVPEHPAGARRLPGRRGQLHHDPDRGERDTRGRAHRRRPARSAGRREGRGAETSSTASTGTTARTCSARTPTGRSPSTASSAPFPIATTRETQYLDRDAPPGAWYRIGVGTNWLDDDTQGDVFAFSRAVATP